MIMTALPTRVMTLPMNGNATDNGVDTANGKDDGNVDGNATGNYTGFGHDDDTVNADGDTKDTCY